MKKKSRKWIFLYIVVLVVVVFLCVLLYYLNRSGQVTSNFSMCLSNIISGLIASIVVTGIFECKGSIERKKQKMILRNLALSDLERMISEIFQTMIGETRTLSDNKEWLTVDDIIDRFYDYIDRQVAEKPGDRLWLPMTLATCSETIQLISKIESNKVYLLNEEIISEKEYISFRDIQDICGMLMQAVENDSPQSPRGKSVAKNIKADISRLISESDIVQKALGKRFRGHTIVCHKKAGDYGLMANRNYKGRQR